MSVTAALAILLLLFLGPIVLAPVERNLEIYFFAIGILAATVANIWTAPLILDALRAPILVTLAVIISGLAFGWLRTRIDNGFDVLRRHLSRSILTTATIFLLGALSSLITAIVAAIVFVEAIGMLRLRPPARTNVVIAGCFAIGVGAALTPAGEPLSAIVTSALKLPFLGLFRELAPWVVPAIGGLSGLGGYFARGDYDPIVDEGGVRASISEALVQGIKVFIFVAGLVLVSDAFEPFASEWLPNLSMTTLFWTNTVSAALDNATLAALESRAIGLSGLRWALPSLLISGGMLIPGNIPNIVCAGKLGIGSKQWAVTGIPLGLVMLGIAFAILTLGKWG